MAETASNRFPYGSSSEQQYSSPQSEQEGSVVDQAKMKADEMKHEAGDMMRSQAEKGTTQAGEKLLSTAEDLHSVSDTLHERGRDTTAKFIDEAASQAERFANYLRNSSGDAILRDAQDYARRQPWLTALGGVALGFVAARMVRASSADTQSSVPRKDFSSFETPRKREFEGPTVSSFDEPSMRPHDDPTMTRPSRLTVIPGPGGESERTPETFEQTREFETRREGDYLGEDMRDDVSDDLRHGEDRDRRSF